MLHYFTDLVRTTDDARSRRLVRVPAVINPQNHVAGVLAEAASRVYALCDSQSDQTVLANPHSS